jgi:hypothetical protein
MFPFRQTHGRGRDADRSAPPAQIRTYRFPIFGSCRRSTTKARSRIGMFPILYCRLAYTLQRTGQAILARCPGLGALGRVPLGSTPFPPPPPPRGCPLCSAASPVLWIDPTSHDRSSSVCVLRLRLSHGLPLSQTTVGSPSLRAVCFHYMPGISDLAGPPSNSPLR